MKRVVDRKSNEPSRLITAYIASHGDWRGATLTTIRKVVREAYPGLSEEWKWGTPVWSHNGLVCAASAFKEHVKINFFKGSALKDPKGLFNAGLDAKTMRSIDFREGDRLNAAGLKALVRAAVALNKASK